ncbi:MAG TPA: hypothetical protein VMV01_14980, partial [Planctomycetota bacterium]|nr:hypothetical protein [Planctomycetota bacterium]
MARALLLVLPLLSACYDFDVFAERLRAFDAGGEANPADLAQAAVDCAGPLPSAGNLLPPSIAGFASGTGNWLDYNLSVARGP